MRGGLEEFECDPMGVRADVKVSDKPDADPHTRILLSELESTHDASRSHP
jgi:hypothetical protein